ncbi:reverse transcriptase domain, reverse transcriptase zinc-binding domain protein [Tanacetum coccineum]
MGLGDFRPISLIGSYYKIIPKLLAERVKKINGDVIGEPHNAFIKGRYILDGVLITNETMEYLKKKKRKGLIFKVDFEKAHDSIDWGYLLQIMKQMGFGDRWCNWVESCLNSSSISILVNGSPTKEFFMERVVRQGDPLSPFLFIIAAEGLNALLKEVMDNDILEEVAGLKINLRKSKLYGVGVESNDLNRVARYMRCGIGEFPFLYLGLPIGVNMRRVSTWNDVIDRFKSRLSEWKAKAMYFSGRLTLVRSVLGSLPLVESDALWCKVIKSIYGSDGVFEGSHVRYGGVWADIIRNGHELDELDRGFVNHFCKEDWSRPPRGRSARKFEALEELLLNVNISHSRKDRWKWNVDDKGLFSVKVLSRYIEEHNMTVSLEGNKTIWRSIIPRKVNVFVWRALRGRLPVRTELDKKGIDLDSLLCPGCDNVVESVDHCLALCENAINVWDKIFSWWRVGPVDVFTIKDFLLHNGGVSMPKEAKALCSATI